VDLRLEKNERLLISQAQAKHKSSVMVAETTSISNVLARNPFAVSEQKAEKERESK
jgi:hypothetical protein